MKKTLRLIGMALCAMVFCLSLTACSDDDDDDNFDPTGFVDKDNALVGSWQYTASGNGWSDKESITFYADGTYSEEEEDVDHKGSETSWEKGIWNTNRTKTQILFTITDSSDRHEIGDRDIENYVINGDKLILDKKTYSRVQ